MKWGKGKKEYGVSKGQLKKDINYSSKTEVKKTQSKYKDELNKAVIGKNLTRKQTSSVARQIGKKYVDEFNKSLLKDIGYKDVEKGKKMLKEYDLNFKIDPQYGVIRKQGLGTHVYA